MPVPQSKDAATAILVERMHRDILQRAMLTDIADDMETVRDLLLNLKDRYDMAEGSAAEDALSGVRRLRLELDAMDAIGWPGEGGES